MRFKATGGTTEQLLKVFHSRIRSTLEFASPVFHSGATKEQSQKIETVQKKALVLILGRNYNNYESALTHLKQERLDTRRANLCIRFALKCTKSSKHCDMFPLNPNFRPNMRHQKPFQEPYCHTSRYYHSSIPSLARHLNENSSKTT